MYEHMYLKLDLAPSHKDKQRQTQHRNVEMNLMLWF